MLLILAIVAVIPIARAETPKPQQERLKAHVETLASPAFEGRRGAGARKAEAYIIEHFQTLGLTPLFGESFTQDIPGQEPGQVVGRNIGAKLPGSDPDLADEWVILSAHYDHLGVRNGVLYPGADDNASGVAMLLEAARVLAKASERPRRGILFIAFDLEENGLWGSRHFVREPPIPLEQVRLFLTADLIAGALGGVCDPYVFVMGSEHIPELRPMIEAASAGQPVTVGLLGSDVLLIDRSDYGPFRARKVPYLFFSTGETPRYHTPRDTPDTLDYPKLESISRIMTDLVRRSAMAVSLPSWSKETSNPLAEAVTVRDVLKTLLQHREELQIKGPQAALMTSTIGQLDAIIDRGEITSAERTRMVRVAQIVLFSVL